MEEHSGKSFVVPALVLRICFENGHQVDWHVADPQDVTFQDVLDVISEASESHLLVTSFEYKDEDGDRITVKSDEELHAMVNFHLSMSVSYENAFSHIGDCLPEFSPPCGTKQLYIYPKSCKHPWKRNRHDLKVAIAPTASSLLLASQESESLSQEVDHPNGLYQPRTLFQGAFQQNSLKEMATEGALSSYSRPTGNPTSVASNSNEHAKHNFAQSSYYSQLGNFGNDALIFLEVLGNGNSGVVRKAIHRETKTVTAVKSITLDLTGEEQQQILRELEILRRCNGFPNIIAFYGAYFHENQVLLCTEYMDGGSLDRYGAIPERVLINVACSISCGLKHLWSLRIMHRDVKPSNVLVNTAGHVKLCDFGVSTQLVDSIARTYIGTNAYMAPERIIGHDYTIYSDVWSFGISLCELATGQFPYPQLASKIAGSKGVLPMELMQCIVNEPPPGLNVDLYSTELVDFVKCCLQKEASKRFLPEQLCCHALVVSNQQLAEQENLALVAEWIYSQLAIKD